MSARARALRHVARGEPRYSEAARAELEDAARQGAKERGFRTLAGTRVFFKYGPLRGKARWRHALRRALALSEFPRIQEFLNLEWLRARGFDAPRPLAAGALLRSGLPVLMYLITEEVPDARTLDQFLPDAPPDVRQRVLEKLAVDLARLHVSGFVHRDLFPRNLLIAPGASKAAGSLPRVLFLDCWRGRPGGLNPAARGLAYDLACFMLEGATLLDTSEQQLFLHCYCNESARRGRRVPMKTLIESVQSLRQEVFEREAHRRPHLSVDPSWEPPPSLLREDR